MLPRHGIPVELPATLALVDDLGRWCRMHILTRVRVRIRKEKANGTLPPVLRSKISCAWEQLSERRTFRP